MCNTHVYVIMRFIAHHFQWGMEGSILNINLIQNKPGTNAHAMFSKWWRLYESPQLVIPCFINLYVLLTHQKDITIMPLVQR